MEKKKKGRVYTVCPIHRKSVAFGKRNCVKRLYFKPENKLRSIEGLWICQTTGTVFQSEDRSITEHKHREIRTKEIGKVQDWEKLFPDLL